MKRVSRVGALLALGLFAWLGLTGQATGPMMGIVGSASSLANLAPGQYQAVTLAGSSTPGDVPQLSYSWSTTPCTSADGVAQVSPASNSAAGCWNATFSVAGIDARYYGLRVFNTAAANQTALTAALAYATSVYGCVAIPHTATPFPSNTIALASSGQLPGPCLKGVRGDGYSASPSAGCQLQFTDATGVTIVGGGARVEDLSICGNADTSTQATTTAGLSISAAYEVTFRNLYIQNFVICRLITGAYARSHEENIRCADQHRYPNLVNQAPLGCIVSLPGSSGSWAAMHLIDDECRYQAYAGPFVDYTADGITKNFQITAPSGGTGSLFSTEGVKIRVGANNILPNNWPARLAPQAVCGIDYNLFDISNGGGGGSGGVGLYCAKKTIQVTSGSTTATVTSGGTSDIPTPGAVPNVLIATDHGLGLNPRISAVNTGAGTITMTAPATMTDTLTVMLTQIGIRGDGCGAVTCGANLEARFVTAPTNGVQVTLYFQDPFCAVAYDLENASDYLTIDPVHVGGCRTLLRYTATAYGGVRFRPSYFEDTNQLLDIEPFSYGVDAVINRRINAPPAGAYAGSYGGIVAPWYVDKAAGATTIRYNNRTWNYNGASTGNDLTAYANNGWFQGAPPGAAFVLAGAALTTTDRAECSPMQFGAPFRLAKLGIDATAAGAGTNLKLYLYARDPVTGLPGKQLSAATAPVAITGTGGWAATMTDYIGSPGMFWGCYVATWTTAPSFVAMQAQTSGGGLGYGGWLLGNTNTANLYATSQPQAVVYAQSGLYAAGLPAYLSGLTTAAASLQPAALSWVMGALP